MNDQISITLKQTPLIVSHFLRRPGIKMRISDSTGNGRGYFVPTDLKASDASEYTHIMDWIERYASTLEKNPKLRSFALDVTSFAKLVDIKINASDKALRAAAYQIRALDSSYFKNLAISLLSASGKPESPGNLKAKVDKFLVHSLPADRDPVVVVSARPLNEFDIMPELAFPQVETGIYDLEDNFSVMKYKDKADLFKGLLQAEQNVGILKYELEIIAEPRDVLRLIRYGVFSDYVAQSPTPAFGYNINEDEVDDTTADMLERCYDMSLKLYGLLQGSKHKSLAQIAVLNGHRQRHLVEVDIHGLRRLGADEFEESRLSREIKAVIANKHPLIARHYFGSI